MTTFLTGVFTNKGREVLSKSFGKNGGNPVCHAKYFKIGMGGYIDTPSGRVPKDPTSGLGYLDLEADGSPGNFVYQKTLSTVDFTFIAPSIMQVRCRLDNLEANDDGLGNPPRFFEVGVFDENDNMIVYATFPEQTKAANKILTNYVQAYF